MGKNFLVLFALTTFMVSAFLVIAISIDRCGLDNHLKDVGVWILVIGTLLAEGYYAVVDHNDSFIINITTNIENLLSLSLVILTLLILDFKDTTVNIVMVMDGVVLYYISSLAVLKQVKNM